MINTFICVPPLQWNIKIQIKPENDIQWVVLSTLESLGKTKKNRREGELYW